MENPESSRGSVDSGDSDSADSRDVVPPKALVGQMFHRFRCIRILGQGAMATVMLGEDIALKRPVAIKLLPREDKSNPGHRVWLDQFVREARAAAQLTHSGIVQVYEIGLHMGYFYIAMEAMLGGSLEDLVRKRGPVPIGLAVAYARQSAEALAYAHRRGVLHRDIKPANILLNDASQCKLGDFGLAILDDPSDTFELPRNFIGTPHFLAPEMLRHKSSPQSDVYALGGTLWFLLTGKYPFAIKEIRDVLRVGDGISLGDLRKLCPHASAELKGLLERALAPKPEARFADAAEMLRALTELTQPAAAKPSVTQSAALSALAKAVQKTGRNAGKTQRPAPVDQTPLPTGARWGLWIAIAITALSVIGVAAAGLVALKPWESPAAPEADAAARNTTEAPKEGASPQTSAAAEETLTPPAPDDAAKPPAKPLPTPAKPLPTPAKPLPTPAKPPAKPQAAPVPPVNKAAVQQAGDGSITLNADHAILHGALKLETKESGQNVGCWLNPRDWVSWEIHIDKPGTFEVTGDVALTKDTTVKMSVGGKPVLQGGKTPIVLKKTGIYDKYEKQAFGKVEIDKPGAAVVEVRAVAKKKNSWAPLNIRSITLTKVN